MNRLVSYTKYFGKNNKLDIPKYLGASAGAGISLVPNVGTIAGAAIGDLSIINLKKRLKAKHPDWTDDKIEAEYWKSRYKRHVAGGAIGLTGQTAALATIGHKGQKEVTKLIEDQKYGKLGVKGLKIIGRAG